MVRGYVSDAEGNTTVMDEPTCEMRVYLDDLDADQALAFLRASDTVDQQEEWVIGALEQGDMDAVENASAEFHFSMEAALTILTELGIMGDVVEHKNVDEEGAVE